MPRNASGTYSLPEASFVAGTTILSASMNSDLSDIATALTQSLATTGVSSMTGPVKLAAGSAAAPSLTLASDTGTGFYNSAAGTWTYVTGGSSIMSISPTGVSIGTLTVTNLTVTGSFSVAANRIVGECVAYGGSAAPSLWLLCYGQAISRTTYASLFGAIGTTFGAGDGLTTFNVPDDRGRVTAGADNMGGSAANRLTTASGMTTGNLGGTGGLETITLTTAQLAVHSHGVTDPGHNHAVTDPTHTHTHNAGGLTGSIVTNFTSVTTAATPNVPAAINSAATGISINSNTTGISINNAGSGSAHNNVQPTIVKNVIIYAAV